MKNTIYNQIQEKKNISFDELLKLNSEQTKSKAELASFLKILESEQLVFQYAGNYYDLTQFPEAEGFVQWNLTGFCWLSQTNDMNSYGITFDSNDSLLSIYNKRDAYYGAYVKGKQIKLEDKEFFYVTSSEITNECNIIAVYQEKKKEWTILNSATNFTFKSEIIAQDNDVFIFNSKTKEFINKLGNLNDKGIESLIIAQLSEIKKAPEANFTEVTSSDIKTLDKPFYTIDSIYTKDIDDAIWIEKNDLGHRLYVAIADVSSYVLPNDEQDKHAQEVGSSFYLPHQTIHMLDSQLAENYCSLNPGVNKQSMVCEMQFDLHGNLLTKEFYQANIMSQGRLTYDDVDKIIDYQNPLESLVYENGVLTKMTKHNQHKQIFESLQELFKFSQTKQKENIRDYWFVEQPEYFLNENGKVEYLYKKEESAPSQKMVETAMLMANISAAQFLYEKYPQLGIFRNQVKPGENELPKPATYDHLNAGHWGLDTPFYTHFTSPIRRYCDLLVHRLIKNIISNEPKFYSENELEQISKKISLQQYKSKQFEIKAKNLLVPQYVEKLLNENKFGSTLNIIDFSDNGIVCRNEQLVEIFIPTFKLEKDVTRYLDNVFTNSEPLKVEEKRTHIEQMNKKWNIFTKVLNYSWTDERKNAMYQISRKNMQPRNNRM